jgi:hypothetical protein
MMEKTGLPKAPEGPPVKEAQEREFPGDNSIQDKVAAQMAETHRVCKAYNKTRAPT